MISIWRIFKPIYLLIIPTIWLQVACKRLIEIPAPVASVGQNTVYSIDATAIESLTGIYNSMSNGSGMFTGSKSMALMCGLGADELGLYSGVSVLSYTGYYQNSLSTILPQSGYEFWTPLYNYIFRCNAAIEGLNSSQAAGLTPVVKQQLLGEAKFLRAFFYFYLSNLFGDVPIVVTTDFEKNTLLARSTKAEVYRQIIEDLQDAKENLSDKYVNQTLLGGTLERVRPTRWAALALLARVYLFTEDWANAEAMASNLINNSDLFSLLTLNSIFLKNSKEAIWQLQPTAISFNTQEAQTFIVPQAGPNSSNNPVFLSKSLLNSFEVGDQRRQYGNWVDTTIYKVASNQNDTVSYLYKYKLNMQDPTITSATGTANMKEYFMVLRLGEQYLVRAEARTQMGNFVGAQEDINAVRNRAFLTPKPVSISDKSGLLVAIMHERQVELFCEWGHRWLDLKRTGTIDVVMEKITPQKAIGAMWQSYQKYYPLPFIELQRAPNLVQTMGY